MPSIPEEAVDIEGRIDEVYERIKLSGYINFSDLVPVWKRKEIVETLLPLLYLEHRGFISCEQGEMFKDISIKLR